MKKIVYIFLLITNSLLSQEGIITIEGDLQNSTKKNSKLLQFDEEVVAEDKIKDGKFKITQKIKRGYYILTIDTTTLNIYLNPDDHLTISADINNLINTLTYSGKGSERNNFLIKKLRLNASKTITPENFYLEDAHLYVKNIQDITKEHRLNLMVSGAEEFFINEESNNLGYGLLFAIDNYQKYQKFYFEKEVDTPDFIVNMTRNLNTDNQDFYEKYPFYRYLVASKWQKLIDKEYSYFDMNIAFYKIKSPSIQKKVFRGFLNSISTNEAKSAIYLDLIKNNTNDKKFIKLAKNEFKIVSKTKKGDKSPSFKYTDVNGKTYSLSDFKGKLVYINVWSTQCTSCIDQIPSLTKLIQDYKDKDIVFVNISIDTKEYYEKWKTLVTTKELKGIQLFADDSFDSKFIKSYGITSAPTFILIDKSRKILERRTSKPSSEKIRKTIDKYLINNKAN